MVIFTINIKEMKEKNLKGFVLCLFVYRKMKEFIKIYFPNYGKLGFE